MFLVGVAGVVIFLVSFNFDLPSWVGLIGFLMMACAWPQLFMSEEERKKEEEREKLAKKIREELDKDK